MSVFALKSSELFSSTRHHTFVRNFSICMKRNAGFQSAQSGISIQMKQRLIERKKRKVEKMSKQPLEFIPIVDFFIPHSWKTNELRRSNPELSIEIKESRILLEKEWARYVCKKRKEEEQKLRLMEYQQELALKELRLEAIDLYNKAVQCIPEEQFPFTYSGPVQSMPLKSYLPPLGGFGHHDPPFSTDRNILEGDED